MYVRVTTLPGDSLEPQVLEFRPHRFSGVKLEGDDAVLQGKLRLFVGEVDGGHAVDELPDVVAFGDDRVLVPVVELERLLEFLRRARLAGDGFLSVFPDGFFADEANPASLAAFVVDEAGDVGQVGLVADLALVAA